MKTNVDYCKMGEFVDFYFEGNKLYGKVVSVTETQVIIKSKKVKYAISALNDNLEAVLVAPEKNK